ncbi:MAG: hypothetical protein ACFFAQ_13630 [Promethearchaeota archaeon]
MINLIISLILEFILLFITIINLNLILNKWKESKNRLNAMLVGFIIFLCCYSIFKILGALDITIYFTVGEGFNLYHFFTIVISAFQLVYVFYLREWKRFYYLPVIISSYTIIGLIQFEFEMYFIIYTMISALFSSSLLVIMGLKNKNGIILMLGLFIFSFSLGNMLNLQLVGNIIRLIPIILLYLGLSDIIDKYFLIDKKEKLRLKSIWISKVLVDEESIEKGKEMNF